MADIEKLKALLEIDEAGEKMPDECFPDKIAKETGMPLSTVIDVLEELSI